MVVVVVAVEGEDGGLRGGQGFLVVFILVDYQAICCLLSLSAWLNVVVCMCNAIFEPRIWNVFVFRGVSSWLNCGFCSNRILHYFPMLVS